MSAAADRQGKAVSRADLLYWLLRSGADADSLDRVACFAGFARSEPEPQPAPAIEFKLSSKFTAVAEVIKPPPKATARWFCVTAREPSSERAARSEVLESEPLSIQGAGEFSAAELAGAGFEAGGEPAPLTTWARLWPFLRRAGNEPCAGALDVARLVEDLAAGRLLPRLPRQKRTAWSAQWIVLADYNPRTLPFWGDFLHLCRRLQALRGRAGLNIRQAGRLPGTPVLILSDLGLLEAEDSPLRARWLRFGHRLAAAGLAPLVLAPLSPGQIDQELAAVFAIVPWNRAGRLARRRPGGAAPTAAVQRLLGLLSPAVRIEPGLLRALRHWLPAAEYDSGCEAAFWHHPDVQVSPLACAIRPEALESHRAAFRRESPALQQRLLELLLALHAARFPAVAHEETLI